MGREPSTSRARATEAASKSRKRIASESESSGLATVQPLGEKISEAMDASAQSQGRRELESSAPSANEAARGEDGKRRVGPETPSESDGNEGTEWDVKFPNQRFGPWSTEEVTVMKASIKRWASEHGLLEEFNKGDYEFLFNRRKKQGGRGARLPRSERRAFIEVAQGMQTRNAKQIYGWILRNMDKKGATGKWSKEETEALLKHQERLGKQWSKISELIGRPASACRDKWRLAKGGDKRNSGRWSVEETEKMVALVQEFFKQRGDAPGSGPGEGNEHLPLLDNINWVTISEKLGTRNEQACLQRWYQIAPPMISAGQWAAGEDEIMVKNIIRQKPRTADDVNWSELVAGRTLGQILRRWKVLTQKVRDYINTPFCESVLQVATSLELPDLVARAERLLASTVSSA
jgi:cyclin-D-binding Myb-like transcription factor 1